MGEAVSAVHGLDAALARQVATVRQFDPAESPAGEAAARVVPALVAELGLGAFGGVPLIDHKPRMILRFRVLTPGPLAGLGPEVILKVYGDRPRGEGPLMSLWRERGVPTPALRFGE